MPGTNCTQKRWRLYLISAWAQLALGAALSLCRGSHAPRSCSRAAQKKTAPRSLHSTPAPAPA
eukprot:2034228-Rhodomonas_salina.1